MKKRRCHVDPKILDASWRANKKYLIFFSPRLPFILDDFPLGSPSLFRVLLSFSTNNGLLDREYPPVPRRKRTERKRDPWGSSRCTVDLDRSTHRERFAIVNQIPEAARDKKLLRTEVQRFVCSVLLPWVNSWWAILSLRVFCRVFSSRVLFRSSPVSMT